MKRMTVQISSDLMEAAKLIARVEDRSVPRQIEHWCKLGRCAEDNPDLSMEVIKEMLLAREEAAGGFVSEYKFGTEG